MDELHEDDIITGNMESRGCRWDGMNFARVDPLGLAPFSKEIEQEPHREMTDEEVRDQRARDLMFEREEF